MTLEIQFNSCAYAGHSCTHASGARLPLAEQLHLAALGLDLGNGGEDAQLSNQDAPLTTASGETVTWAEGRAVINRDLDSLAHGRFTRDDRSEALERPGFPTRGKMTWGTVDDCMRSVGDASENDFWGVVARNVPSLSLPILAVVVSADADAGADPVRKVGYRAKSRGFLHRCGVLAGDVVGEVVIALHQIEKAALCLKSCDETVTARPEKTLRKRGGIRKDGVLAVSLASGARRRRLFLL